jgi:hypothetical protein
MMVYEGNFGMFRDPPQLALNEIPFGPLGDVVESSSREPMPNGPDRDKRSLARWVLNDRRHR